MAATFTVDDQWKFFSEFCDLERRSGGPDPHLKLSVEMSRGCSVEEKIWRAGCYIAVYNAPFGEAIWRDWSWDRITSDSAERELNEWLAENFKKLVTRRERRCVRRAEWMAEYLLGYREFAAAAPDFFKSCADKDPEEQYNFMWEKVLEVPRLGRYVALKLLEFLRVADCGFDAALPDLRAEGGWSPREMLSYLYPDSPEVGERDDSFELVALAEELASDAQKRLVDDFGVEVDKFELQVLLCDYKQSWKGMRQYPGRSIDSELEYAREAYRLWGRESDIWRARRMLFPVENLGEVQGWSGPRQDVAKVLATFGYTWSDLLYDYQQTKSLGSPVKRKTLVGRLPDKGVHAILPGQLFQSGTWSKLPFERCRNRVTEYGLTGVVNLWHDDDRLNQMVDWYRHAWMSDGKKLPEDLLNEVVEEAVAHLSSGGKVLVMCQAGRNRSGLVNALIVRRLIGCSGKEALDLVRAARPRAVANDSFSDYVETLAVPESGAVPFLSKPVPGGLF